jgi:hypothetical protein
VKGPRNQLVLQLVTVLQSITMPTKNFFLSSSLAPTHSSHYPFLYSAHKRPLSDYSTDTSLNCQRQDSCPVSSMTLNCNLTQTSHDMPSSHVRHLSHLGLLEHWMYSGMPSGPYIILGHLRQLGHPGCHRQCSESLDCSDCCVKSSTIEMRMIEHCLRGQVARSDRRELSP